MEKIPRRKREYAINKALSDVCANGTFINPLQFWQSPMTMPSHRPCSESGDVTG
jgi:hypothetical protein